MRRVSPSFCDAFREFESALPPSKLSKVVRSSEENSRWEKSAFALPRLITSGKDPNAISRDWHFSERWQF
jgi:hypothetical protein